MRPTKVFVNGKRLKDMYVGATRWQVFKYKLRRFVIKLAQAGTFILALYIAGGLGSAFNPKIVYAEPVVVTPPVLERIAQCESHKNHYCTDALVAKHMCPKGMVGQVLVRGNNNKSVDVGLYQINADVWGATATKHGFNIFTEEGNKAMALWIYENKGTEPWYSSAKCWAK